VRHQKVDELISTNALVAGELKSMRAEFQRLKAIEHGTLAERDPVEHPWLH
jgi:hypothetical protein